MITLGAAYIFTFFIAIAALFQIALALGVPWGSLAMGGRFPGKFPPAMRAVALVQMGILAGLAAVVLARAGAILPGWFEFSRNAIWGIVAFSVLGVIANLATPSKWERIVWAPVTIILAICSFVVAMS